MSPKTPASPLADTPSVTLTPSARMARLLAEVRAHAAHVQQPAQMLRIEVDGDAVASCEITPRGRIFVVPTEAHSVTLRDQAGVARAHVLVQQDSVLDDAPFDSGRLRISMTRAAEHDALELVVRASHVEGA